MTWDRVRAAPIDTSPHDLHVSDCLDELRPGDHIEIQWRRNKEFPYGMFSISYIIIITFIIKFYIFFFKIDLVSTMTVDSTKVCLLSK